MVQWGAELLISHRKDQTGKKVEESSWSFAALLRACSLPYSSRDYVRLQK